MSAPVNASRQPAATPQADSSQRPLSALLERLPEWARTIRFRLTVAYSTLLFALAALVVGGIYFGVSRRVSDQQLVSRIEVGAVVTPDGDIFRLRPGTEVADLRVVERLANARALHALQTYSLWALLGLFVASLLIGWWLSGRVLTPIAHITSTAADITATDLSRRISLSGPDDELRRLGETIDGMLGRLEEAFGAQRQIVDDASHELRNPLAIIRATVDAVLSQDDVTPAERHHASDVVVRASDRMTRLVDDLLATARRAGPAFLESGVDIASVGREALEEIRPLAPQLTLRSGLADGIAVVGDRDALRRAIANLLSNAVRFCPDGGEVLLAAGRLGDWAWVAVRDEGPGIAPEHQGRVFDRFYRVEGRGTSGHAGLGLAIVRQIVESHGGAVAVHSQPGRGATFVLWLRVGDPRGEQLSAPVSTDPLSALRR